MAKILELNADNEEILCNVSKALSVPDRIKILKLLYYNSYNIKEIADLLQIPASTAALHIKILENANLILTEQQPGCHGSMKLCSRKNDFISIRLNGISQNIDQISTISMPVGAYTNCSIVPTCGMVSSEEHIGYEDQPSTFFLPARFQAQLLWSSGGFVEYKFPYSFTPNVHPKQLLLSFEACSEAPNYREDWKSDITIWINDKECGTWHCPGDFGSRRGRLNPAWWENGQTQFGSLVTLTITDSNTLINNEESSKVGLASLELNQEDYISVRIGNKKDALYPGGFNLFGSKFGDYDQDINLSFVY